MVFCFLTNIIIHSAEIFKYRKEKLQQIKVSVEDLLKNALKRKIDYYDLILTGDLGKFGASEVSMEFDINKKLANEIIKNLDIEDALKNNIIKRNIIARHRMVCRFLFFACKKQQRCNHIA